MLESSSNPRRSSRPNPGRAAPRGPALPARLLQLVRPLATPSPSAGRRSPAPPTRLLQPARPLATPPLSAARRSPAPPTRLLQPARLLATPPLSAAPRGPTPPTRLLLLALTLATEFLSATTRRAVLLACLLPALALAAPPSLPAATHVPNTDGPAVRPLYLDKTGVIRWRDSNTEVALYGANYCLMSGSDYRMAGLVSSDRKAMVDEDLAQFAAWAGPPCACAPGATGRTPTAPATSSPTTTSTCSTTSSPRHATAESTYS